MEIDLVIAINVNAYGKPLLLNIHIFIAIYLRMGYQEKFVTNAKRKPMNNFMKAIELVTTTIVGTKKESLLELKKKSVKDKKKK